MRRAGLIAAILLGLLARSAASQVQASAEVGSAILRQTGLPESGVMTLGADLRVGGLRASLASSALGAVGSNGGGTGQAVVTGAIHAPLGDYRRWHLSASASTFGQTDDLPVVSAQFLAREFIGDATRGFLVGAGGGGVSRNGVWRPALLGQAGVWQRIDDHQLIAALSVTSTRSEAHINVGLGDIQETSPASYVDLSGGWLRERGALSLGVSAGARAGIRGVSAMDGWVSASATAWIAQRLAVVGTAGRALDDVVRGIPQAHYASVSLRVALQPRSILSRRAAPLAAGPRLVVSSAAGGTRRIEVQVAAATSVEIMADFTQWSPIALVRDGGVWRVERVIDSGPHRVAVRIDGGEWMSPVNLPSASSGFGGMVGLITVP